MKAILILLALSPMTFAQGVMRTERIFEVPQPPVRVRQYVPQDVEVPQPPKRFKEITEVKSYTVPLDEPTYSAPITYRAAPVKYAAAPVAYAAPVYMVPVYAVPRRIKPTPVRDFLFGR